MNDKKTDINIPKGILAALILLLFAGFVLRTAGLYRGIADGYTFHPDEAKQIHALHDYLQGKYIRHYGSLFYDGYPFFLNHFDEWIIRALSPAIDICHRHLAPGQKAPEHPELNDLYYWARTLRVFYGMCVLLMCFTAARKLNLGNHLSLLATALLALAPVSIVVAHSASGDIALDLFLGAAILTLCIHHRKPTVFLIFATGFMTGFAFAAKYHGALGCLIIAMYCTFRLCMKQVSIRKYIAEGAAAIFGFIVSIHIAIPQLVTDGDAAWTNLLKNLAFIKNYNLDKEFLEKPFAERAWLGIADNTPYLISNIGPILVLLSAGGAILITGKLIREISARNQRRDAVSNTPLLASVFIFPFLAALLSLLGKGKIQAFHFSYTILPLVLSACYCIKRMWAAKHPLLRVTSVLLAGAALVQSTAVSLSEDFFWRKDDTKRMTHIFAETVLRQEKSCVSQYVNSETTRNFDIENGNPSTFRNLDSAVTIESTLFWNNIQSPPVPCVPFPLDSDWIFTEGPVFPRNDRMFTARHNRRTKKHVVMYAKPATITIGVRTGSLPVVLEISTGKTRNKTELGPDSQEIITLPADKWRHIPPRESHPPYDRDIYLVPLEIYAKMGNVWVTVLTSERDITHYRAFGGETEAFKHLLQTSETKEKICAELNKARFLEGEVAVQIRPDGEGRQILPPDTVLPCGIYKLHLHFLDMETTARIRVRLYDHRTLSQTFSSEETFILSHDAHEATYCFQKPFSPHECYVIVESIEGEVVLHHWELLPDIDKIISDINSFKNGQTPASWMRQFPCAEKMSQRNQNDLRINYGRNYTLDNVVFPSKLEQGASFTASVRLGINRTPNYNQLNEEQLVFRFIPSSKATLPNIAIPLRLGFYHKELEPLLLLSMPEEIQPGIYDVVLGIYNTRTRKNQRMKGPVVPEGHKRRECWYKVGRLEITPRQ